MELMTSQMRPLLARRLHDADAGVPIPGVYDSVSQLTVDSEGHPIVAAQSAYDTFTEAGRDPADPTEPPEPERGVETATRVARDPADPPDPSAWHLAVETVTKTIRDPGDELIDSFAPGLHWADDMATGIVAF